MSAVGKVIYIYIYIEREIPLNYIGIWMVVENSENDRFLHTVPVKNNVSGCAPRIGVRDFIGLAHAGRGGTVTPFHCL